ncbi:MAG: hypothetical protein Q9187_007609 [Circinaria calcarea]
MSPVSATRFEDAVLVLVVVSPTLPPLAADPPDWAVANGVLADMDELLVVLEEAAELVVVIEDMLDDPLTDEVIGAAAWLFS